jgi:hypothetical protein
VALYFASPGLRYILVVNQLSYEPLERLRPNLDKRGIERLFTAGAVIAKALHRHGATYTGRDPTTIASGSSPCGAVVIPTPTALATCS